MTAPDLWLCVNVGVDGVDIMAKEMSVVWLIVDFFSSYHQSDVREQGSMIVLNDCFLPPESAPEERGV